VTANLLLDLSAHPIIGHRGASGLAPENTLPSFDLALEQGAEALELDVRLDADGVPVVLHDPTVDRTTNGNGAIGALSAKAISGLDAGARFTADGGRTFPYRGQSVGIPTLAQVLGRYPSTPLLVELKTVEAAEPVQDALAHAGAERRVVVASFHDGAVAPYRAPPWQGGASRRDIVSLALRSFLRMPPHDRGARLFAVPIRYKDRIPVPTRAFVRGARTLGRPVHVWTVNEESVAEMLWDRGCAGMITNFPGRLRALRDRRFGHHREVRP
jgi:glycerophosphoryl diester phosphodiesterase